MTVGYMAPTSSPHSIRAKLIKWACGTCQEDTPTVIRS